MENNFCRAWQDTWKSFGWKWKHLPAKPIILYVIGLLIYWVWQGVEAMTSQVITGIAFGLIPVVLYFVGLFVFHLIRAPVSIKLDEEHKIRVSLEDYKKKLAPIELVYAQAERAIDVGNVSSCLDFYVDKMYWKGLKDISDPYVVAECRITSRFIFDLKFNDINKVPFTLSILNEKAKDENTKRWQIAKEAKLVWFESMETEKTMEPRNECKITALHHSNQSYFKFSLSPDTRDRIQAYYAHNSDEEVKEIKLEFSPEWQLKNVSDERDVRFYLTSPMTKDFTIWAEA